ARAPRPRGTRGRLRAAGSLVPASSHLVGTGSGRARRRCAGSTRLRRSPFASSAIAYTRGRPMTQRSLLVALLLLAGCSRARGVDPSGGVGTEHLRLRVAQLRLVADPTGPTPLRLVASDKRTSVLADVSLSGPGVWDPATERLSAEV